MTPSNIFEELRSEHDRHRKLMDQIEQTKGDSKERRKLFAKFVEETDAHAAAEEQVFYSRLMEEETSRGESVHSIEEHQGMRSAVRELERADMSSSGWLQSFATVRHKFEHHMKEEEHGVFQLAGKVLTEKEKTEMVGAFRDALRKLQVS